MPQAKLSLRFLSLTSGKRKLIILPQLHFFENLFFPSKKLGGLWSWKISKIKPMRVMVRRFHKFRHFRSIYIPCPTLFLSYFTHHIPNQNFYPYIFPILKVWFLSLTKQIHFWSTHHDHYVFQSHKVWLWNFPKC